jgi:carboxyl-terminal processing protease
VLLNALPAIHLLCPTNGNDMVNPVGAVVVPGITNVFYGRAGAPRGDVDREALRGICHALRPTDHGRDELLPGGVAYLSLPIFSSGVPARVYSSLRRLAPAGVSALILDLRGCPGGELISAVELADDFLARGSVIVTATDGDGDETVYRARGDVRYTFPLFLLVDHLTASAAEIFTGSLQAHGRAVVVGERTYGKGSAQEILPRSSEPGALIATVATFTLPGGVPIEGCGVRPDVEVPAGAALGAASSRARAATSPTS